MSRLLAGVNRVSTVVLTLLAGGGLAFLALSRDWAATTVRTQGLPPDDVAVSGTQALPLVSALALVVLTSGLAVLASGPRLRRVLGVLVVLVSAGALVALGLGSDAVTSSLRDAIEQSPAFAGRRPEADAGWSWWSLVTAAAFVVTAMIGVVTARFGGTWSTMSRRYEAPGAVADDPQDYWKALDDGRDPTE